MRNRSASCCPTSIHGIEPVVASHPISAAYHWCYTGSKPLQCSGYHRCLSVPLDVLISRDRSRQIETATAVWVGVEPVPAGCVRRSAGVARVTTGEHWLALGCTGASQAHTGATPYGGTASSQHVYKTSEIFVKNLRFRTVVTVIIQMSRFYRQKRAE